MIVPPSFENARKSGQISPSTKIIYSIGGYSYSQHTNAFYDKFGSYVNAIATAKDVASWNCDGIDIDIENGAGNNAEIS